MSIAIGRRAPDFSLECVEVGIHEVFRRTLDSYRGKWLILLFYPRDFSFVCPTELIAFSARIGDFQRRHGQLLGVSIDSIDSHRRWLATPPEAGGVGPLRFPLATDADGQAALAYQVWNEQSELPSRGLFVIDPEGVLQYYVVHNLNVGRNADEALRVLEALQSGGLCPAGWTAADGTVDVERMLQPGRVLAHYRIEQVLGRGTFGAVFKAHDLRLERTVALKVLKRTAEESRVALLNEARLAARVDHPAICTIYSVDEHDGLPVIVMQFVDGRPLSAMIGDGISADVFRSLAIPIADGLATAHRQGVVHGDLKPANILVNEQGQPCLVDFGLAAGQRHAQRRNEARPVPANADDFDVAATLDGMPSAAAIGNSGGTAADMAETLTVGAPISGLSGTPAYMSPEQAAGLAPGSASDVFSLGLVLCEMLSGRMVLHEESLLHLLASLDRDDISARVPSEAGPLQGLLRRMLQRHPADRPTANEVWQALQG